MSAEIVEISSCPKCQLDHRYRLEVTRSIVVKTIQPERHEEPARKVNITRVFTCPTTSETYQASFGLTDTSLRRIQNVAVLGMAAEYY